MYTVLYSHPSDANTVQFFGGREWNPLTRIWYDLPVELDRATVYKASSLYSEIGGQEGSPVGLDDKSCGTLLAGKYLLIQKQDNSFLDP